jgi:hypothetical protein
VNKIKKFLPIPFCLILLYFLNTGFVSTSLAQVFEFNEEDYFSSEENEELEEQQEQEEEDEKTTTNAKDSSTATSTDFEDTDKEPCIDGQIESSAAVLSATSDDSYTSNFHFVKKFDRDGNLIGSWGTVGSNDGQFLHAHGIIIDSQDNVYVSDAEHCNIQKFDKDGNFITKWGTKGIGPGKFLQPESMDVDSLNNIYVAEYSRKNIQKFDSNGKFITMWGQEGQD